MSEIKKPTPAKKPVEKAPARPAVKSPAKPVAAAKPVAVKAASVATNPTIKKGGLTVDVLDQKGKSVEQITLAKDVFGADINTYLIHAVATAQANNARQGTKSTLTRSEVRGHAAKPYRQKGTGRARQGSTKGPHFDGGGVAFAPKPRDFSTKVNKKQREAAFISAISGKVADRELVILKDTKIKEAKTKNVQSIVDAVAKNLGAKETAKMLFVTDGNQTDFVRSAANIPTVHVTTAAQLCVLDVVKFKYVVASVAAVKSIEKQYGGAAK